MHLACWGSGFSDVGRRSLLQWREVLLFLLGLASELYCSPSDTRGFFLIPIFVRCGKRTLCWTVLTSLKGASATPGLVDALA
jgi:hypothetical protein